MAASLLATSASGNTGSTGLTHSHAGGSGSNTAAVVAVLSAHATTTITCTYGGVSMTAVTGGDANDGSSRRVKFFVLANPPSGTQDVVVTQTNGSQKAVVAWTFEGVDQSAPIGDVDSSIGASPFGASNGTLTLTTTAGDVALCAARLAGDTTALTPDTGDTEDRDADIGADRGFASRQAASGGSTSVGWAGGPRIHATVAVVVRQHIPTYTGTGAGTLEPIAGTGTGTFQGVYTGVGAGALEPIQGAGTGTFTPVYTGSGAGTLGPIAGAGAGTFTPVYTGVGAGTLQPILGTGAGSHHFPSAEAAVGTLVGVPGRVATLGRTDQRAAALALAAGRAGTLAHSAAVAGTLAQSAARAGELVPQAGRQATLTT